MNRTETDIFFEELPSPALFFDSNTLKIKAVNNAAIALYGYSSDEMLSLSIKDLRPKEEIPKLVKYLNQDLKSNSKPGVWRHLTKDDKSIYVDISCREIHINGQNLVLTILNDVTKLIQIESRFKESQVIQKLFKKELPGVFFIFNSQAKLSHWNNNAEAITEYSTDEITEMGVTDFFSPSDKRKFIKAIKEVLDSQHSGLQINILTKSGVEIPFFFNLKRTVINGEYKILGIGVDVSSLIEAQKDAFRHQKLMQTIIDQTGSLVYIKDVEGTFRYVNKEFLNLFDLDSNQVIGKKDTDLLRKDEVNQIYLDDEKLRANGDPIQIEEQINIEGETKTFLTTKILLTGVEKYENCVFGISNDITERIKIEEQLRDSLKEKKILLKEIHHRVKNNLAVVSGMMDLQSMESENVQFRDQIRDTQARIKSIALTHELLYQAESFSNVQFSENIRKQTVSIRKTFNSNVDFRFNIEPVILNINQALPCSLIINEILTNALKHAFKNIKKPVISITLSEKEGLIKLSIQDNGIGLQTDFKVEKSKSLGMKLIKILTKQLNAKLKIDSSSGTLFNLEFKKYDISGSGSSIIETVL